MVNDLERVITLLTIVEMCAGHNTKFSSIAGAAMAELTAMNEDAKQFLADAEKKKQARLAAMKPQPQRPVPIQPRQSQPLDAADSNADTQEVDGDVKPSVYPSDSQTATIADRRV